MNEATPYVSDDAGLLRRNRRWLALGMSPWAIALGLVVGAVASGNFLLLTGLPHMLIFGLVGLSLVYRWNPSPVFEPAKLTADHAGVHRGAELLATREELKSGFVMPYKGKTVVRLTRRGLRRALYISVRDVDEGRRLLRSLGLDATQTIARVRAVSQVFSMSPAKQLGIFLAPVFGIFASIACAGAIGGPHAIPFGLVTMPFIYAFLFTMALSGTKVEIGADGIATRWLGRHRYFPFSQIERVDAYEGSQLNKTYVGVEIVTRRGERMRILTGQKRWGDEEQAALIERIREAIEAYRSGISDADASVLARNGRAPKDWISALKGIGAGANADMRTAAIPLERLWRVMEDASASPLVRAGAAIALAPQVPPSERGRIRVAAETTASPKLRIALERASERETPDEELLEAISSLEADG